MRNVLLVLFMWVLVFLPTTHHYSAPDAPLISCDAVADVPGTWMEECLTSYPDGTWESCTYFYQEWELFYYECTEGED